MSSDESKLSTSQPNSDEVLAVRQGPSLEPVSDLIERVSRVGGAEARQLLISEADERVRAALEYLGCSRTLDLLQGADPAERARLLGVLPLRVRMQWDSNEQFPEQTVGRFMDPTEAVFPESLTVGEVREILRELVQREFVTYGYVIDDRRRLVGVLVMRELLFANPATRLTDIVVKNPFSLTPEMKLADAMKQVVAKHFPVYPVTDEHGQFIGVVRGGRLFEAQAFEISAQPGKMVGVEKEERLVTAWTKSFRFRHPWLQLNLLTAFVAGAVVSVFQGTINQIVILAAFLPVLAGQSGNTGCQALAVTLRGITLGDYSPAALWKLLRKEALLGLVNGFFVGLVAAGGMFFMASTEKSPYAWSLSAVVLVAMMGSCMISGVSGVLVPVTLKRLGFDPATASSIFLTTATDVASMGMLLGLASAVIL